MKQVFLFLRTHVFICSFFLVLFLFSWWLMFSTFSYENGTILIASKAWSDFGSHIPLIRSFSFGYNFPPEYPLFAGEPIHYHFLFYAFVGFLERIGIPLDLALNVPSAISFFCLLVMLYIFSYSLFKSKFVGVLSILFFVFNGSLSFLYFFKNNSFSVNAIGKIPTAKTFTSFHPYYGDNLISAFWNLNIYTNQRHLAAAFAFSLFIILLFLRPVLKNKNSESISINMVLGISLGLSFYFHIAAFGMTTFVIIILSILFPKIRNSGVIILILALIFAYPQYKYMNQSESAFGMLYKLGYLTPDPVTIASFTNYWVLNLGLHVLLIPVGFLIAPKKVKKIFIAFFGFFIIGNIFQFSPEVAANHKFFNYFMLMGGILSAYTLAKSWTKNLVLKPFVITAIFFLIISGVMDIFPIYNDTKIGIDDYTKNPDILWIKNNTPQDAVFLNTSYFLPVESIAGRKVFFGWPYFAWSQGYDTNARGIFLENLLSQKDVLKFCKTIGPYTMSFLKYTSPSDTSFPAINPHLINTLKPIYSNKKSGVTIYDIQKNCKK